MHAFAKGFERSPARPRPERATPPPEGTNEAGSFFTRLLGVVTFSR